MATLADWVGERMRGGKRKGAGRKPSPETMAESFGGLTAIEASYSLGMAGHIKWQRNIDGEVFRCTMSMQDGLTLTQRQRLEAPNDTKHYWKTIKAHAQEFDIQSVMPEESKFGWTMAAFVAWWAGIAAGMVISANRNRVV